MTTVEQRGVEHIPHQDRWGKPNNLFWMWAGAVWNVEFVVYGALAVEVFGLSFAQAVLIILIGNVFYFLTGLASLQGPEALATSLTARWRDVQPDADWGRVYAGVHQTLVEQFATVHSLALQQSMWEMGRAALAAHPVIAEIRLPAPNKHPFPGRPDAVRAGQSGRDVSC